MSSVLGSADLAARAAALAERARSERPPAWIPDDVEKGHPPTIAGVLVGYDRGMSAFGERTIAIVREPDGREWSVWLHSTVLRDEFEQQKPALGELLAVSYLGRRQAKVAQPGTSGEYGAFRLVVDRGDLMPHQATAATVAVGKAAEVCPDCGYVNGQHADGCLPF